MNDIFCIAIVFIYACSSLVEEIKTFYYYKLYSTIRSQSSYAPNWFLSPLALQVSGHCNSDPIQRQIHYIVYFNEGSVSSHRKTPNTYEQPMYKHVHYKSASTYS